MIFKEFIGSKQINWVLLLIFLTFNHLIAHAQCDFSALVIATSEVSCYGLDDGKRWIMILGLNDPYEIKWGDDNPITVNKGDTIFKESLVAGQYDLHVSDNIGCDSTFLYIITQPPALEYSLSTTNINCGSGMGFFELSCIGGTPAYSYSIDNSGWCVMENNFVKDTVDSGFHSIVIMDKEECTHIDTFEIQLIDSLKFNIDSIKDVTCFGYNDGFIQLSIEGGTPPFKLVITEEITNSHFIIEESSRSLILSDLKFGIYRIKMYDHHGCYTSESIPIYQPKKQYIDLLIDSVKVIYGSVISINADFFSDRPPIEFFWEPPGDIIYSDKTSNLIHPSSDIMYVVKLVDNNGCFDYDSVYIDVILDELYVPNAFTPNNDGKNDIFKVIGFLEEVSFFEMLIFSRWGTLIEEIKDPYLGWDGTHNGKLCPQGVYVWKVTYESKESPLFSGTKTKMGTVTLLN